MYLLSSSRSNFARDLRNARRPRSRTVQAERTTRDLEGFSWRCMADPEGNEFDIDVLPA